MTFSSLSNRNYRTFFVGQAISLTGTWMQSIATAWLVLQLTGSPTWLGFAVALQFLPLLVLGPYGGVWVDRIDKRHLLIGTQSAAALLALTLGLLTVTGRISLTAVLVLSLGLGLVNVLDNPGRQAFVREMVGPDQVRNAVSLNAVLVNVARAIGPAVAGVLIATVGVGLCFLINSLSFLAAIAALLALDVALLNPTRQIERASGQLRAGLSYVRQTPDLLIPLLMMGLVGTLTYEFAVTLPALVRITFESGAASLGWVTSAMGVGSIIGGLISASRTATGIKVMVAASAVFAVTDALAALAPTVALAAAALACVGAASIWFLSIGNATLQLTAAPQMRGRVMSLWSVAFLGSTTVGGPIVGWLADAAGPRWALALGALAAAVAAVLGALAAGWRPARRRPPPS